MLFAAVSAAALFAGCARVAIEGGEKPIKIDMTVTLKVDRELDEFFAFERKYEQPTTQPATLPATVPAPVR
jgi:hypothetical protein